MPRRREVPKREILPDPKFHNVEVAKFVNVLMTQWGALFTNTEDFSGRPSVVDGGGYVTYIGQENRQHALGHALLWGLKEPVMPWCSDGPDEAELGAATKHIAASGDRMRGLEDVCWALLNANEFLFQH